MIWYSYSRYSHIREKERKKQQKVGKKVGTIDIWLVIIILNVAAGFYAIVMAKIVQILDWEKPSFPLNYSFLYVETILLATMVYAAPLHQYLVDNEEDPVSDDNQIEDRKLNVNVDKNIAIELEGKNSWDHNQHDDHDRKDSWGDSYDYRKSE